MMFAIGDMVTQVKNKANIGIIVAFTNPNSKHTTFLVQWFDYHGPLGYRDYELIKVS